MAEYVVIGLGTFGRSLATAIQELGNEVIGVDIDRETVQEMSSVLREAIQADATSEAAMRELGVGNVDAAIVATGSTEDSIMITLILKKMGVVYVIAKAATELHGEILRLVGADRVIFPEKETAIRLAHGIAVPEIVDYLSINRDMGIIKLEVSHQLIGRSYGELLEGQKLDVHLVGIMRGERALFGAVVGEKLQAGDILVVAGRDPELRALGRLGDPTKSRPSPH